MISAHLPSFAQGLKVNAPISHFRAGLGTVGLLARCCKTLYAATTVPALLLCATVELQGQTTGPKLRLVEEMRIDGNKEEFSVPNAFVLVSSTGQIAFADRMRYQVRFYDRAGRHLADVGGRGGGPGEFASTARIGSITGGTVGDSIWYYDPVGRRLTIVSDQRTVLRTTLLPPLQPVSMPNGGSPRTPSFDPLAVYGDGSMLGRQTVVGPAPGDGRHTDLALVSKGGALLRLFGEVANARRITVRDPISGRTESFTAPFAARSIESVAQDGSRLAIVTQNIATRPATLNLTVVNRAGDTLLARQFPMEGVPVTAATADSFVAMVMRDVRAPNSSYSAQFSDEIERGLRKAAPSVRQPVTQVKLGLDNTIWLALPAQRDSQPWLILDERGNVLGQLLLGLGDRFILGATRSTQLWGIVVNADGVPSIVRYRIERAP